MGNFSIYQKDVKHSYLESLGPLIKPTKLEKLAELKIEENKLALPPNPSIQNDKIIK